MPANTPVEAQLFYSHVYVLIFQCHTIICSAATDGQAVVIMKYHYSVTSMHGLILCQVVALRMMEGTLTISDYQVYKERNAHSSCCTGM